MGKTIEPINILVCSHLGPGYIDWLSIWGLGWAGGGGGRRCSLAHYRLHTCTPHLITLCKTHSPWQHIKDQSSKESPPGYFVRWFQRTLAGSCERHPFCPQANERIMLCIAARGRLCPHRTFRHRRTNSLPCFPPRESSQDISASHLWQR